MFKDIVSQTANDRQEAARPRHHTKIEDVWFSHDSLATGSLNIRV